MSPTPPAMASIPPVEPLLYNLVEALRADGAFVGVPGRMHAVGDALSGAAREVIMSGVRAGTSGTLFEHVRARPGPDPDAVVHMPSRVLGVGRAGVIVLVVFRLSEAGEPWGEADHQSLTDALAAVVDWHLQHAALETAASSQGGAHLKRQWEVLAHISHELTNPLTSILGWTAALDAGRLTEPERSRAYRTVRRNAESMQRQVQDLSDMMRLSLGKLLIEPRALDAAAELDLAVDSVRPRYDTKGVRLSTHPMPGKVLADPHRLQQMLTNLLVNAAKWTAPGGSVRTGCRVEGRRVVFFVADDGAGIPPGRMSTLFDRFAQVDVAQSDGGLGLGLHIVRSLARLHGGDARAESAGLGHGSLFEVWLPRAR